MNLIRKVIFQPKERLLDQQITDFGYDERPKECNRNCCNDGVTRKEAVCEPRVEVVQEVVIDLEAVADDAKTAERRKTENAPEKRAGVDALEDEGGGEDIDEAKAKDGDPV